MRLVLLFLASCAATPSPVVLPARIDPPVTIAPMKKGPALAKSTSTLAPAQAGLEITITSSAVLVAGNQVATVPFDASVKRNGPNDLFIVPIGEAVKKSGQTEARLSVAPDVAYRPLIEVLFTLGQNDISTFHFFVEGPNGTAMVDVIAPRVVRGLADAMSGASRRRPELNASVILVGDGISIKASGGNIAPGCNSIGAGLAIAQRDWKGMSACLAKLKASKEEFAEEDTVTISATADIDFQTIVLAMDASRTSLPVVQFAIFK